MTSINLKSSITHVRVDPATRAATVIRGGERGIPGTDGIDGLPGSPIMEGTAVPGDLPNGYFFFDTDDVLAIPAGVISSGSAASSGTVTPLTTSSQDVPGCTTGALTLAAGDVVLCIGAMDSLSQASVTNIGVLDINGVEESAQILFKSTAGTDRAICTQTWRYVVPSAGSYTFKLRVKQNSGSGGVVNQQHTTLRWQVMRSPVPTTGVLKYKKQNGVIVTISGVGTFDSAAGNPTEVLFNNGGALAGAPSLLVVGGTPTFPNRFDIARIDAPAAPGVDTYSAFAGDCDVRFPGGLYTRNEYGWFNGPTRNRGRSAKVYANGIGFYSEGYQGFTTAGVGAVTPGHGNITSANAYERFPRARYTATATNGWGAVYGAPSSGTPGGYLVRGNTDGIGGFYYRIRFSPVMSTTNGDRTIQFFGLLNVTDAHTGLGTDYDIPNLLTNCIGVYADVTWTGGAPNSGWKMIFNDAAGTPTITNLPSFSSAPSGKVYELTIWCYPNDNIYHCFFENITDGVTAGWEPAANIPSSTKYLSPYAYVDARGVFTPQMYLYEWYWEVLGH